MVNTSAKNYAAQAHRAAKELASKGNLTGTAKTVIKDLSRLIPNAQHFSIPDGGKLFDDGLKGLFDQDVKLPFPCITVETFCDGFKYCVTAFQDAGDIGIMVAASEDDWVILPFVVIVSGVSDTGIHAEIIGGESDEYLLSTLNFCACIVLELCEALSCSNVDSEVIEPVDAKANEKRVRKGKLPLYETRRLVIKVPLSSSGGKAGMSVDRNAPREHLRRGHIRRLQDERKIWVQSCVVGHKELGVIHKSYSVTK